MLVSVMEHSYLVPGGNILFLKFVTYILDLNINEKHYIYFFI
jgi:hypothetical protein